MQCRCHRSNARQWWPSGKGHFPCSARRSRERILNAGAEKSQPITHQWAPQSLLEVPAEQRWKAVKVPLKDFEPDSTSGMSKTKISMTKKMAERMDQFTAATDRWLKRIYCRKVTHNVKKITSLQYLLFFFFPLQLRRTAFPSRIRELECAKYITDSRGRIDDMRI